MEGGGGGGGYRLHVVEEVEMLDALPQLHQDVQQAHLVGLARPVHHINVLCRYFDAEFSLHPTETDQGLGSVVFSSNESW